ncbi:MAG: hypothetical protein AAF449_01500 [Myxococcota bacterium]
MLVDHRYGIARICPASTLYLGARRWAQMYSGRGPCDVIDVAADPSAITLMQIFGVLRVGAQVHLHRSQRGPVASSPGGLSFAEGSALSREHVAYHLARPQESARRWWSLSDWTTAGAWDRDLLPALARGAELHINLHHADRQTIEEDDSWPDVIGSVGGSKDILSAVGELPTRWISASALSPPGAIPVSIR